MFKIWFTAKLCGLLWAMLVLAAIFLAACASGVPSYHVSKDGGPARRDLKVNKFDLGELDLSKRDFGIRDSGRHDLTKFDSRTDSFKPILDGPKPKIDVFKADARPAGSDANCLLGTPDNCKFCGDVCPPGNDLPSTSRVCQSGKCNIECKGDYYDVNDKPTDGCEFLDDLPLHEVSIKAIDLGKVSDCATLQKTSGVLPSDNRRHLKAPVLRANGLGDWFKIHIQDIFNCVIDADVQISLKNFPSSALFGALAYYDCDNGVTPLGDYGTSYGNGQIFLNPDTTCSFFGDDSGTLYVLLFKDSGPHSNASYSLEINP